jgi:hypothetical protein
MDGNHSISERKIKMGCIKFREECGLGFEVLWRWMCRRFRF